MSTLFRALLIGSLIAIAFMATFRPRQLREWGAKARLVALIYVAAIIISAAIRMAGWGT